MVRLAPSANNRQPWRIVCNASGAHFYLQRSALYDRIFGAIDLQRIDMGIALCHFELGARETGHAGVWRVLSGSAAEEVPAGIEYVASWVVA